MAEYQPDAAQADNNKRTVDALREVVSKCFFGNEDVRAALGPHETKLIIAGDYINATGEVFSLLLFDMQNSTNHDVVIRMHDQLADVTFHVAISTEGYVYPQLTVQTLHFLALAVEEMITNHEETGTIAAGLTPSDEQWDEPT